MPPDAEIQELVERHEMNEPGLTAAEVTRLREADTAHQQLDAQVQGSRAAALREWILETRCR